VSRRVQRVGDAVRETIADLLLRDVRDPRVGMVTLTDVRMSPDLRCARVAFSTLGDADARAASLAGLRSASGFIRKEVARRLHLRVAPEIRFEFDPSLESAERISRILQQARRNEDES